MIETTCGKCGKKFIPAPQHMYKDDRHMYCSWTCYNHRESKDKAKGSGRSQPQTRKVIQCDKDGTPIKEFPSALNAAEYYGYCQKMIRDACKNSTQYRGYLWRYKNDLP